MTYSIGIIGGAAAGVSMLVQLVDKFIATNETNTRVIIIEKNQIGYGAAYGTREKTHILNLSKDNMSLVQNEPMHFSRWIKNNKEKWQDVFPNNNFENDDFPPRLLYGLYLEEVAKVTIERAKNAGIKIQIIKDEAIDITRHDANKFVVSFTDQVEIVLDQIILAIGHMPSSEYQEFLSCSNYYPSPWLQESSLLSSIPNDENITLIGTRLTAIDAVLSLVEKGHKGTITLVSRNGLLPRVIGQTKPYSTQFLKLETISELTAYNTRSLKLNELVELFWKEIEAAEGKEINQEDLLDSKSISDWLKDEIETAENTIRPWQSVLASVYPIVPVLWSALDSSSQKEFLKQHYSLWMTYLAAFPLQNAKKIAALLTTGQLKILGGLQSIKLNEQTKQFEILTRENGRYSASYLINAMGPGHDITKSNALLLKNLLEKGMIKPHPLGGIDVDFNKLQVIDEQNNRIERLFVIGDQTWGVCMATADLSQVRREANRITNLTVTEISLSRQLTRQSHINQVEHQMVKQKQIKHFLQTMNQSLLTIHSPYLNTSIPARIEESEPPVVNAQQTKKSLLN